MLYINIFITIMFINICTSIIFLKVIKYENITIIKKILLLGMNFFVAILYIFLKNMINTIFTIIISYLTYNIIISIITNKKTLNGVIITIISLSISYLCLMIATIIEFLLLKVFLIDNINKFIEYIIIGIIQLVLVNFIFKINRLKDGFSFLKLENKCHSWNDIGIFISVAIIIISIFLGNIKNNILLGTYLIIGLALGIFIMFKWIKEKITENYKKKMIDRTIQIQAEEIKQKDEKIKELKAEIARVSKINHSYNHRISSVEEALKKLEETTTKKENKEEIEKALNHVQKISK